MPGPAAINTDYLAAAQQVFALEAQALQHVSAQLGPAFTEAITLLKQAKGRVIVTGMGKSGLIGKKIAATFSSTGTAAYFLHPAEGSHGDLGLLMPGDVVVAISYSGETPELLTVLPVVKRLGLPLIALTRQATSTLGVLADVVLNVGVPQEACPLNLAPTASTTATLVMGDALAVALLTAKGFTENDFALVHPAGALGRRLLYRVSDVMHTHNLPFITPHTPFLDALLLISDKRLGLGLIVDEAQHLLGILTDGDIRRALQTGQAPASIRLTDAMTQNPKTLHAQAMAAEALHLMQQHSISALVVLDPDTQSPIGVCHLQDLLKAGIR